MEKTRFYTSLGMMSGTSMDGVDIAVIKTDGRGYVEPLEGGFFFMPYTQDIKDALRPLLRREDVQAQDMQQAAKMVTQAHSEALDRFFAESPFAAQDIDVIGFHGQTITHKPEKGLTIQLGNPQDLADASGCDVIFDLRQNDVKNGGQGAPLIPVYHRALIEKAGVDKPVAVLNLGGVGNVTFIGVEDDDMLAFDTGPANAYLDDWVQKHCGKPMDEDAKLASAGQVDGVVVEAFLQHPYFQVKPPKSLDRLSFEGLMDAVAHLNAEDGAATLLECSARAVHVAAGHARNPVKCLYVCGGGARNPLMMKRLAALFPQADVRSLDVLGHDGDAIEAEGFAYLAVRHLLGLNITYPGTTGVKAAMSGGVRYIPQTGRVEKAV